MDSGAQIVRITIDQLAQLVKALAGELNSGFSSELPPGQYNAKVTFPSFGITAAVVLPQDPRRWGIIWSGKAANTPVIGLDSQVAVVNGMAVSTANQPIPMLGNIWRPFVMRDIWGISNIATTTQVIEIIKQD